MPLQIEPLHVRRTKRVEEHIAVEISSISLKLMALVIPIWSRPWKHIGIPEDLIKQSILFRILFCILHSLTQLFDRELPFKVAFLNEPLGGLAGAEPHNLVKCHISKPRVACKSSVLIANDVLYPLF